MIPNRTIDSDAWKRCSRLCARVIADVRRHGDGHLSEYPAVIDPTSVGQYSASAKSGGGYFYDEVLEYRVWCHPENGAPDKFEGEDYFFAFATYEEAFRFSSETPGSEVPLVLIRQFQWIDEPQTGHFVHEHGERIAEWRVEWLADSKREADTIETFLASNNGA